MLDKIYNMDCITGMKLMDDNSIDAVVTDPPYELGFMGKQWDKKGIANNIKMWKEALRILKPGAHLLSFGGSRTYHRMACAIEDAGFEIRDQIMWVYGSGFPKSLNIGKAVDKLQGNERDVLREEKEPLRQGGNVNWDLRSSSSRELSKGNSQWEGWGTALKPAHEPIVVARKPLSEPNVAQNVLKWGTGGINVDGCRVGVEIIQPQRQGKDIKNNNWSGDGNKSDYVSKGSIGRFPANFIHDGSDEVLELFPDVHGAGAKREKKEEYNRENSIFGIGHAGGNSPRFGDSGSASRFFYCAKASKAERNKGCNDLKEKDKNFLSYSRICVDCGKAYNGSTNHSKCSGKITIKKSKKNISTNFHPTVKPIALMRYLIKLITPPDGIVLDPFIGSGTTAIAAYKEHKHFIGFEKEKEYCDIANARILHYTKQKKLKLA